MKAYSLKPNLNAGENMESDYGGLVQQVVAEVKKTIIIPDESDEDEPIVKKKNSQSARDGRQTHNPDFINEKKEKRQDKNDTFPAIQEDPPIQADHDSRSILDPDFHVLKERFPNNQIWDVQRDGNCWIWAILVQVVKKDGSEFSPKSKNMFELNVNCRVGDC
ncbi:hypothetical protein BLNAU_13046 [Blattamonas nauphoetae]|uniref:Uncharacterized protein n=1 Tax=Blattamonas nauphoetae TaxID=2049346 RepID=A0ABQ9XIT8_9EUKA|nr:hypothetical protein BLNAU_13046 [Blattamonas nauphoetae]